MHTYWAFFFRRLCESANRSHRNTDGHEHVCSLKECSLWKQKPSDIFHVRNKFTSFATFAKISHSPFRTVPITFETTLFLDLSCYEMSVESKDTVKRALEKGEYSICDKADSASADCWSNYDRIQDGEGVIKPFVRCRGCSNLLAYDSKKNGTSSLAYHAKNCRHKSSNCNRNIAMMFALPSASASNVSSETKRSVTDALARLCASDMRPFEIANGVGFEHFCQTILDIGRRSGNRVEARQLIPDSTTVSRRVQSMAEGEYLFKVHARFFLRRGEERLRLISLC